MEKVRVEFIRRMKDEPLSDKEKIEYFQRLILPYNNKNDFFITQYLEADGNELKKKFFSKISSSRLAFELYSWLVNEKGINNFSFEKKLTPALKGSTKCPNMDVYFEYKNRIIFIENKFTEYVSNDLKNLSPSYYLEQDLCPKNSAGSKYSLEERFGDKLTSVIFSKFVKDIKNELINKDSWFDVKQEVTHLFGIIQYLLNENVKDKNIEFYNVVYDFGDIKNSDVAKKFISAAKDMIETINQKKHFGYKKFVYEVKTVQEITKKIPTNAIAFGLDNITVRKLLLTRFKVNS